MIRMIVRVGAERYRGGPRRVDGPGADRRGAEGRSARPTVNRTRMQRDRFEGDEREPGNEECRESALERTVAHDSVCGIYEPAEATTRSAPRRREGVGVDGRRASLRTPTRPASSCQTDIPRIDKVILDREANDDSGLRRSSSRADITKIDKMILDRWGRRLWLRRSSYPN